MQFGCAGAQHAIGDPRMAQKDGPVRSVGPVAMQWGGRYRPGIGGARPSGSLDMIRNRQDHAWACLNAVLFCARAPIVNQIYYCGRWPRRDYRGSGGAVLMQLHVAPVQQGQCGSGGGLPPSMSQGRISISMITFMSVCVNLGLLNSTSPQDKRFF